MKTERSETLPTSDFIRTECGWFKPKDALESSGGLGGKQLKGAGESNKLSGRPDSFPEKTGEKDTEEEPAWGQSKPQTRTHSPTLPRFNWIRLWSNWCPRVLQKTEPATGSASHGL